MQKMPNLRSLKLDMTGSAALSDLSFLQLCPNIEFLSLSWWSLSPNHCKQFLGLRKLTTVDLGLTRLTSEAMLLLLQSLSPALQRFRHAQRNRVVMSHFDVVVGRFPCPEEFSVGIEDSAHTVQMVRHFQKSKLFWWFTAVLCDGVALEGGVTHSHLIVLLASECLILFYSVGINNFLFLLDSRVLFCGTV